MVSRNLPKNQSINNYTVKIMSLGIMLEDLHYPIVTRPGVAGAVLQTPLLLLKLLRF